jgi:hypothetical protein
MYLILDGTSSIRYTYQASKELYKVSSTVNKRMNDLRTPQYVFNTECKPGLGLPQSH